MDPAQAAAIEALITYIKQQRTIVDYLWVASPALLIYDYLLCFNHELKYIWLSAWSYTTFLFAVIRYLPMVLIYFNLQFQLLLNSSFTLCQHVTGIIQGFYLVIVFFSETILMIRVWAIWHRNKYVGIILACLQTASLAISSHGSAKSIASFVMAPAPYPGFRGCFILSAKNTLTADFAGVVAYQSIVLMLVVWSAFRLYKTGNSSKLSRLVHRDGIIFYVYLLGATIVNLVLLQVSSIQVGMGFIPIWGSLYSIFTCRVILRIRHGTRGPVGVTTIHHFDNDDSMGPPVPMDFSPPAHVVSHSFAE